MSTFVLVHGAWLGGWAWQNTAQTLRTYGHRVSTPTLTGCGERAHLLAPDVNLSAHATDVANHIDFENLQDVILVGHSYAGMVITEIAERALERITQLVYLDAFTPQPGESVLDQVTWADLARQSAQVYKSTPVVPPPPAPMMGLTESEPVLSRLTPFPLAAFEQRLPFRQDLSGRRAFVRCAENPDPTLVATAARAREAGWPYREIVAPHNAMLSHAKVVAEVLHELALVPNGTPTEGRAS